MPARLELTLVSFGKFLLRQPLLPDTFHTKQWMSSGEHWVFIRRTHVRWIYDEFSTRWRYTRLNPFPIRFFPFKFLLSFPACFLWHFRRVYEACKIVTVFNRKIYANEEKNFFNEPPDNVCLIVLCSEKKTLNFCSIYELDDKTLWQSKCSTKFYWSDQGEVFNSQHESCFEWQEKKRKRKL